MTETPDGIPREEIEVGGNQLVETVKHMLHEGNVRHLKVLAEDGEVKFELPMTLGVVAGSAVVLAAPWLAVLGVIAAMVKHVRIVVEREEAPSAAPTTAAPTAAPVLAEPGRVDA